MTALSWKQTISSGRTNQLKTLFFTPGRKVNHFAPLVFLLNRLKRAVQFPVSE